MISGTSSGRVEIWRFEEGEFVCSSRFSHYVPITALALSRDGTSLLVGLMNGTIRLYDLVLEKSFKLTTQHGACVRSLAISDDGRFSVSVSEENCDDPTIVFWDLMPPTIVLSELFDLLSSLPFLHLLQLLQQMQ